MARLNTCLSTCLIIAILKNLTKSFYTCIIHLEVANWLGRISIRFWG